MVFLIFLIAVTIIYFGVRIVAGIFLPKEIIQRFEAGLFYISGIIFKLIIVVLAGLLLWAIFFAPSK